MMLRKLCEYKGIEIIEAEACKDHIHMLVSIPPKYSVSQIMGYLKGKSSLMIFEKYANLKYKYGNRHFWCRGYYVDTVGRNKKAIEQYIRNQLQQDYEDEQFLLQDYYINNNSNKINIYVQYEYIEVKLAYTASVDGDYNLEFGDINLTVDNYASYEFKKGDNSINQDTYVNYSYGEINIYVYMKDVTLNDGTYNLSLGVNLDLVSCNVDADKLIWNQNTKITNGFKIKITFLRTFSATVRA